MVKFHFQSLVVWVLFLACEVVYIVYPGKWFVESGLVWVIHINNYLFFFVLCQWIITICTDPGTIPKEKEGEIAYRGPTRVYTAKNRFHSDDRLCSIQVDWCRTCNFYRPPSASHCAECNVCVEGFDHHCPWLNKCIGRRNHKYYVYLLVGLFIEIVHTFATSVYFVIYQDQSVQTTVILIIIVIIFVGLAALPIGFLLFCHCWLVSSGLTTREQLCGKMVDNYGNFNIDVMYKNWAWFFRSQQPTAAGL